MTVEQRNFEFYDAHYRAAHPLLFWLHGRLSYDQLSKTRPNLALLRSSLHLLRTPTNERPLRVLDYGSGFGTLLLGLPRRGFELYAYDLSPRAVTQLTAAARLFGREVRALDLQAQGPRLDLIVCSHVLEHVPSDAALIARFVERLEPSGLLLVNVPVHELWDDPKHTRRYTEPAVFGLLERHGLVVLKTRLSDRWSAWLCRHEQQEQASPARRVALRAVRLLLGQAPNAILEAAEQRLLTHLPMQQLLVLAQKPSSPPPP